MPEYKGQKFDYTPEGKKAYEAAKRNDIMPKIGIGNKANYKLT